MKERNKRGITLIALVITVIILLILAGTAIGIAVNGGDLFGKTSTAKNEWNAKVAQENTATSELMEHVEYYSSTDADATPSMFIYTVLDDDTETGKAYDELEKVADISGTIKLAARKDTPYKVAIGCINFDEVFKNVEGWVSTNGDSTAWGGKSIYDDDNEKYYEGSISKLWYDVDKLNTQIANGEKYKEDIYIRDEDGNVTEEILYHAGDPVTDSQGSTVVYKNLISEAKKYVRKLVIPTTVSLAADQKKIDPYGITYKVTVIGSGAFSNDDNACNASTLNNLFVKSNIEEIVLPETIETIAAYAFENTGLKKINLPIGLTTIGSGAFDGCDDIVAVYEGTEAQWNANVTCGDNTLSTAGHVVFAGE